MSKTILNKAILFDADGTLLDSMKIWDNVSEEYLIKQGLIPEDNLSEKFKDMSFKDSANYLINTYQLKISEEDLIKAFMDIVKNKYATSIKIKDGVKEFLAKVSNDYKLAIVTINDSNIIKSSLVNNNIDQYFSLIVSGIENKCDKSSSFLYDLALNKLNISKENTYVFEDSLQAILTLKNTPYKTIGIYDESSKENWFQIKENADYTIKDWSETKWIKF